MKNSFYRYSQFYNKLYKNPDEYVVACNYFNVIKSHYNYFFYPKKIKFIKSFFNFFFRYLKKRKKNNVKKKKILIISNFISSKYIFKNDFYFSHLIANLKRNSFHIYYRNIEEKNYSKKNSFFYLSSTDRNIVKDLYYIFRIIYKLIKLRVFYNNKDSFSAIAINKCFDIKNILSTLSNINEVDKIISFIEKCQPKKIFFTYEGYAWEKLFIFRLKKKYPNILLFGFYFSIISQYQNSPFLPKIKQLIPDYILTSGNVQRKKFIKYDFNENKIFNIGSNKKLFHLKKNIHLKRNKKIILLPEAFIEEVLSFINFAKKCSKIISDKFILRLHPSLLENIEMNKIIKQKIANTNIFISNQKIEKDFNLSRVAIYRGSSSVIEAVNYGLIPTYLAIKNELSIDPLFEISKYIKRIMNPLDLKKMTMIDSYSYHKNLVKVQNYCKDYFMSQNQKNIKKIISF